jgi:DNA repair photolyase
LGSSRKTWIDEEMQLITQWQTEEKFDRKYHLEDEDGELLEEFEDYPSLRDLRTAERHHGERIDLSNLGVPCSNCGTEIRDRFSADPRGNLICWDCAVTQDSDEEAGIRVNTDPTDATISESHLYEKSLCDYVVNVATGCRHGCRFCYVPTTPGYEAREEMLQKHAEVDDAQKEWGTYLLYRDDLPERLSQELQDRDFSEWERTKRGRGIVMISSGTDPYQDQRASQITRDVVYELASRGVPARILTRSSIAVKDVDLFTSFPNYVTVGSSIPSLKKDIVKAIEPGAPPPLTRWQMLDMLQLEGVPVYVSMSPTYPTLDEHELFRLITRFKALSARVVFHEPINPRGENFDMLVKALEDAGLSSEAGKFRDLKDPENWVEYSLKHLNWVQKKAQKLNGPPIHSWPDRELVRSTNGELRDQLAAMRQSVSPESFGSDETPEADPAQAPLFDDFEEIKHLIEIPSSIKKGANL